MAITTCCPLRPSVTHLAALSLFLTPLGLVRLFDLPPLAVTESMHALLPLLVLLGRTRLDAALYCLAALSTAFVLPTVWGDGLGGPYAVLWLVTTGVICAFALTMRRWREEAILKEAAMDQLPVEVIITDACQRVTYTNRIVSKIYGLDRHQIYGRSPRVFSSGETPPEVYADMWRTVLGGDTWRGTLLNTAANNEPLWTEISLGPVYDGRRNLIGFAAARTNVTEHIKREHQLLAAWNEASAANRLKGDFLGHMSHELRTPLNAILGFSESLMLGIAGPLPERQDEYVKLIHGSAHHLLDLINDVLDLSRIEAGRMDITPSRFAIDEVVAETVTMLQPLAEARKVAVEVQGGGAMVLLDRRRSLQILINLVSNAVKYTPEGGRVTITFGHYDRRGLSLTVADNGIGIAPDDIKLVLTPFGRSAQVAGDNNGTGLGLPIAKRLTELQGGSLWLTSKPGEGTTVLLKFPSACVDQPEPMSAAE